MNLLGIESVDHLPPSLTHDPRVYSRVLTEEDLRKEREHNKERENKKKEYRQDRKYKDHKKVEDHNKHKQEREHKNHKEIGHHKEPREREGHSENQSKPDPQLLLQALTPRDVRILVQAEEELSQTKVIFLCGFLRQHFWRMAISDVRKNLANQLNTSLLQVFRVSSIFRKVDG